MAGPKKIIKGLRKNFCSKREKYLVDRARLTLVNSFAGADNETKNNKKLRKNFGFDGKLARFSAIHLLPSYG